MPCLVAYIHGRQPGDIVKSFGLVDTIEIIEYIVIRFRYKAHKSEDTRQMRGRHLEATRDERDRSRYG
jgi:hypothetical protein